MKVGRLSQAALEVIEQTARFIDAQLTFVDGRLRRHAQALQQGSGVMLHGFQHIGIGVTTYYVVNAIATAGAEANVHGVGCAE